MHAVGPDAITVQMVDIFAGEIDFHRRLRVGDRFALVYETLEADGEPMRTGRVLSVEFVNNGKSLHALWFQEPGSKGGYYSLDGKSLTSSYLASPMEFSRVTSGFKMRFHPILHQWKAHSNQRHCDLRSEYLLKGSIVRCKNRKTGSGVTQCSHKSG